MKDFWIKIKKNWLWKTKLKTKKREFFNWNNFKLNVNNWSWKWIRNLVVFVIIVLPHEIAWNQVGEGTLPWAIFRFQIFSIYFSQKFKTKITVWKGENLTMYENFCLELVWYYYLWKALPKKFDIWPKAESSTPALGHIFAFL